MYPGNILKKVHNEFVPDKVYHFRVLFPNPPEYQYSGGGKFGPGADPCPYKTWFPAVSIDIPVGWFVTADVKDFFTIQVPIPSQIKFQRISLTFVADIYKRLENWLERWCETIVNGGKLMGTLCEIARPLEVIKTYANPGQAPLNSKQSEINKGFNSTRFYVVPDGEITDKLSYESRIKNYTVTFNIVGKRSDIRTMMKPKVSY